MARLARQRAAGEQLHDLLLEKSAPLLDHDDVLDLLGEGVDQRGIERVGDAELEQREDAGQAELLPARAPDRSSASAELMKPIGALPVRRGPGVMRLTPCRRALAQRRS